MSKQGMTPLSDAFSVLAFGASLALAVTLLPPVHPVIVILGSLKLHLALIILGLAALLLLLRRPLRGTFYVLIATAGCTQMAAALAPSLSPDAPENGKAVSVISFNILGHNRNNGERIADFLIETAPDIAFIQEAQPLRPYLSALDKQFPYRIGCGRYVSRCDSMLLSRHRLSEPDYYQPQARWRHRFYTTRARIDGQTITLAALHLTKAEFGDNQLDELDAAAAKLASIDGPVIVAGDFNTALWAPHLVDFLDKTGLKRAMIEPATWPGGRGILNNFGLPIDHIFVRGGAIDTLSTLSDTFGSNHRGLQARLVFPEGG